MKHANIAFFIPHIGCPNRCSFCDQNTISGHISVPSIDEIHNVLNSAVLKMKPQMRKNSEIAFFGGSFTAIDRDLMISLLETASNFVSDEGFSGIRVSTRPDAIDEEILDILKKYKVSSIELGAQSMDDDVLHKNRRGHSAKDVIDASKLIKSYGFSLGLQMMTGLYSDTLGGAIKTAEEFIALNPDTVRIYPTVVLKGTHLAELYINGVYQPFSVDETVKLCAVLLDMFEKNNINVIRIGLHDQPNLKDNFVAGAYHPALGELIMGEQLFNKTKNAIKSHNIPQGDVIFAVNPKYLSQFIGQKKNNINRFKDIGYTVTFRSDETVFEKDIKLI